MSTSSRIVLFVTFCMLSPVFAQQDQPTMNPSENKSGGFFNLISGDRPKGARTEISASDEVTFDNEKSIAQFSGRVVVKDAQFTMTCDKLIVYLGKDRKGIDTAEAVGNVVIIQEKSDPQNTSPKSVGRAGEVTYKPAIGEVTMRKWPSIQQGINNQVATDESTVMILKSSGQSRTIGASKTLISETATKQ